MPPSRGTSPATPKAPWVRVPVLSKTMVSISRARSKAARSRISSPLRAVRLVLTATTSGTARPRAWGQQMTITVTMRSSAKARLSPTASQMAKRRPADAERAIGQAECGPVGQVLGAGAAGLGLADHLDDLGEIGLVPGLVDLDRQRAFAVDRAGHDAHAGVALHRLDSPVSMASLRLELPSRTIPSIGTFSPGLIRTRSPVRARSPPPPPPRHPGEDDARWPAAGGPGPPARPRRPAPSASRSNARPA